MHRTRVWGLSSAAPRRRSWPRGPRDGCATLRRPIVRRIGHLFASKRPTSAARSACEKSGPVRRLRGLEGCPSVGRTAWGSGLARAPSANGPGSCSAACSHRRDPSTNGPMRPLTRPRTVAGRAIGARRRAFPSRWQKRAAGVAVASKEMVVRDCGDGDEGLRYLPLESAGMRRAAPCMARCVRHAVRAATRRLPGVVVYASCLCRFAVVGMVAGWDHVVPSRRC